MLSIEVGKLAMIRPDLIIFDCDGVLVDSELLSCRCLSAALAGDGINLGVDQALDLFLGRSLTTGAIPIRAGRRRIIRESNCRIWRMRMILPRPPPTGITAEVRGDQQHIGDAS